MSRLLALPLVLALAACGGTTGGTDSGPPGTDAPATADAPAENDAGSMATHGCEEADFVDRRSGSPSSRMIMVPRGTFSFDFPCMTISAGQAVMFMWDFSLHPLAPGVAPGLPGTGTEPSPIVAQTSGALYEPTFTTPGDYPFHCATHFGSGMVGVVRVVP